MKEKDLVAITWSVCPNCNKKKCVGTRNCQKIAEAATKFEENERKKNDVQSGNETE